MAEQRVASAPIPALTTEVEECRCGWDTYRRSGVLICLCSMAVVSCCMLDYYCMCCTHHTHAMHIDWRRMQVCYRGGSACGSNPRQPTTHPQQVGAEPPAGQQQLQPHSYHSAGSCRGNPCTSAAGGSIPTTTSGVKPT